MKQDLTFLEAHVSLIRKLDAEQGHITCLADPSSMLSGQDFEIKVEIVAQNTKTSVVVWIDSHTISASFVPFSGLAQIRVMDFCFRGSRVSTDSSTERTHQTT
jgi:hypothetical protein